MATPLKGVKSIKLNAPGVNGAMPETFAHTFGDVQDGSVSFNIPSITKNKVRVEDKGGVRYILPGENDEGATFAANSIDIDGAMLAFLTGGTWTSATKTFTAPVEQGIVYAAIQFESAEFESKNAQFSFPFAAITFNFDGVFTKGDLVSIGFEGEAMTPSDASGTALAPWSIKFNDIA